MRRAPHPVAAVSLVAWALAGWATGQGAVPSAAGSGWSVTPFDGSLGAHVLSVHTETGAWVLTGRDAWWFAGDGAAEGAAERHPWALPVAIDATSVAAFQGSGIWLYHGSNGRGWFIETPSFTVRDAPSLGQSLQPGSAAVIFQKRLHIIIGGPNRTFVRLVDDTFEPLPETPLVHPLGTFSSGMVALPTGIGAFGDHHVGWYDGTTGQWKEKADVHIVLRMRPALGAGGLSAWDPQSQQLFLTLGKASRSIGVADFRTPTYFHLRPRLPFRLDDPRAALMVLGPPDARRLVLVSPKLHQRAEIPLRHLERIRLADQAADVGSLFRVSNALSWGNGGELIRHHDSTANATYLAPWVYTHRKNIVRRFHVDTFEFSSATEGHQYGEAWASEGSAMACNGTDSIFIMSGNDRKLWVLHPKKWAHPEAHEGSSEPDVPDMLVTEGPELPDNPGKVTSLLWHRDRLFLLLDTSRTLWAWTPGTDQWLPACDLPASTAFPNGHNAELLSDGDDVLLVVGAAVHRWNGQAWDPRPLELPKPFSQDGGMAVLDSATRRLFVIIGGGSRDACCLDLNTGELLAREDFLPDAVSVPGSRAFLRTDTPDRRVYILRGCDTDELWSVAVGTR